MTDKLPPAPSNGRARPSPRLIATACLLLCVGCNHKPELAQVAGQVTFQDAPVAEALVLFSNAELGVYVTADVADGRYQIATADGAGIRPGRYQVAISPPMIDHPLGPILEPPKPVVYADIPRRYHDAQSSGLTAELVAGENVMNFDMQP